MIPFAGVTIFDCGRPKADMVCLIWDITTVDVDLQTRVLKDLCKSRYRIFQESDQDLRYLPIQEWATTPTPSTVANNVWTSESNLISWAKKLLRSPIDYWSILIIRQPGLPRSNLNIGPVNSHGLLTRRGPPMPVADIIPVITWHAAKFVWLPSYSAKVHWNFGFDVQ